ncbi:MAG: polysaccharide deacetylase family protein [candidate division NC10 bacterium]
MNESQWKLRISCPDSYRLEREYIISVLIGEGLGLNYSIHYDQIKETRIELENDSRGVMLTLADVLFQTSSSQWLSRETFPILPLTKISPQDCPIQLTESLPVLFGRPLPNGLHCIVHDAGIKLGLDVFGSAFFLLTRYEEFAYRGKLDQHSRFPAIASIAWQEDFLQRPLVDEYRELLWSCLHRLWSQLQRKKRPFQLFLTFDLDHPLLVAGRGLPAVLRNTLGDVLFRRDLDLACRRLQSYYAVHAGHLDLDVGNSFDFLLEALAEHHLQGAFFFFAGRHGLPSDVPYSLDHPWIRQLMGKLSRSGHQLGLHGSYSSFEQPNGIQREFNVLQAVAQEENIQQATWGGRQHYLRWDPARTWRTWAEAGLDYDSTVAYSETPGFRCGTCAEFPVFDLVRREPLPLRERPLILMEASFFNGYRLDLEHLQEAIRELSSICHKYGGTFALLWHNDNLISRWERRCFKAILFDLATLTEKPAVGTIG